MTLSLYNSGSQTITSALPHRQVLEKLGLDVEFRDAQGAMAPWHWGPAHADRADEPSDVAAVPLTLKPKEPVDLPPLLVALEGQDQVESDISRKSMVTLNMPEAPDGHAQTMRLTFKLKSFGLAPSDKKNLESEAFEFRVGPAP